MGHLAFWLAAMQGVLFHICNASKTMAENCKSEREANKFEENIKSYGILLAHISGFASINFWCTLQQNVVHHVGLEQVWMQELVAFGVTLLSGFGMALVLIATSKARRSLYLVGDGIISEFEEKEDDLAKETEHDVVGMTISFSLIQVFRFFFDSELPNVEGNPPKDLASHDAYKRILCLLCSGLLFALLVMKRPSQFLIGNARVKDVLKITWSTSFAWSLYFANYWLVRVLFGPLSGSMEATMTVVLALVCTSVAFACIFALERLEDAHISNDMDKGVATLILSLAILVGFSWERGFDVALDIIAKRVSGVAFSESEKGTGLVVLFLAIILSSIVLPAWRWYILPCELDLERSYQERRENEKKDIKRKLDPLSHFADTCPPPTFTLPLGAPHPIHRRLDVGTCRMHRPAIPY
jgi:hypothetical protein